jgi:TIR domain
VTLTGAQHETSRRLGECFIYSETDLDADAIRQLQADAESLGHNLQFRSTGYVSGRTRFEVPLAFVSHDSRDKEVARAIAVNLQKMLCPVWYDEFSLKAGDNLRDSIEKGLKECGKCVLVLSPNFLSNNGWTKKEFDSVFTREILEETALVLPVWLGVTKHQVFEYSPGLLNVKGLEWGSLGEEEVCRLLHRAIMDSADNHKNAGA